MIKTNSKFLKLFLILLVSLMISACSIQENNDDEKGFFSGYTNQSSNYGSWHLNSNVGVLNDTVAKQARKKYTRIKDKNNDITIMIYMCGADLESTYGMASSDLSEMAAADLGDNVKVVVYAGGSKKWHIDGLSSKYNQIIEIVGDGKLKYVKENAGSASMVDPDTLSSFIEFAYDKYEADRYALIFWDHGAGSVSGYGSDENYPYNGSMTLDKIDEALSEADVKFDFIGFDACLMANTETALMLSEHADYLIASEESEPGIGWYYTDWLNDLAKDTSLPTIQIGKKIADTFIKECQRNVPKQSATLSVIDLAELENTLPSVLSAFANSTTELINDDYKKISSARSSAREFAQSSNMDLVDLVDMANNVGNKEAEKLVETLLSCIKYNNVSKEMSNSYGLSIYFPYRSTRNLSSILETYEAIDMNSDYSNCIRSFSSYTSGGQISSGGSHSSYSIFDSLSNYSDYDDSYNYSQQNSSDILLDLFSTLLSGGYSDSSNYQNYYDFDVSSWFFKDLDRSIASYVSDNHFDADLNWQDGKIALNEEQWSYVDNIALNVFIDDGEGYIDLGKDNILSIDEEGNLLSLDEISWLAASSDNENYEVVPFYYTSSYIDGDNVITYGRIPLLLNGKYANLLLCLDDDGIEVIGAVFDYREDTTVLAKNIATLNAGDELEFVCDYYDYDGNYNNTYKLGDKLIIQDKLYIGDVNISDNKPLACYEIKDIYQQSYYTELMK